jgi:phosphoribosyl-ATP pyrophosphohydrolase
MSYQEDTFDWQAIRDIDAWLDREVSQEYRNQPLAQDWARITKIAEELGETVQAFIGYTGQNPRKGVTNGREEVLNELADVVFTATLALQHFVKDPQEVRDILRRKLAAIEKRVPRQDGGIYPVIGII